VVSPAKVEVGPVLVWQDRIVIAVRVAAVVVVHDADAARPAEEGSIDRVADVVCRRRGGYRVRCSKERGDRLLRLGAQRGDSRRRDGSRLGRRRVRGTGGSQNQRGWDDEERELP
jgi:hypothetical protein